MMPWSSLNYWKSGEWQVIMEKLNDLKKKKVLYCPSRANLFAALSAIPMEKVRVAIIGQDPYPNPGHATGIAFSIPSEVKEFPPTLVNFLKEYQDDLHYPAPRCGDLRRLCNNGVLLWNAIPSCLAGVPGSHRWTEWEYLTKEIVEKLNERNVVFLLLGRIARSLVCYTDNRSRVIETSHPSPLGVKHGFVGSRIFSRANAALVELGKEPIDWRLP